MQTSRAGTSATAAAGGKPLSAQPDEVGEHNEWQTVQAGGRKSRKQPSTPHPEQQLQPGRRALGGTFGGGGGGGGADSVASPGPPPRARTPSCVSLNSTCSTVSRDIEIISG